MVVLGVEEDTEVPVEVEDILMGTMATVQVVDTQELTTTLQPIPTGMAIQV